MRLNVRVWTHEHQFSYIWSCSTNPVHNVKSWTQIDTLPRVRLLAPINWPKEVRTIFPSFQTAIKGLIKWGQAEELFVLYIFHWTCSLIIYCRETYIQYLSQYWVCNINDVSLSRIFRIVLQTQPQNKLLVQYYTLIVVTVLLQIQF